MKDQCVVLAVILWCSVGAWGKTMLAGRCPSDPMQEPQVVCITCSNSDQSEGVTATGLGIQSGGTYDGDAVGTYEFLVTKTSGEIVDETATSTWSSERCHHSGRHGSGSNHISTSRCSSHD